MLNTIILIVSGLPRPARNKSAGLAMTVLQDETLKLYIGEFKLNNFFTNFFQTVIDRWSKLAQFGMSLVIGGAVVMLGYFADINFLQSKLKLAQKQKITTKKIIQTKQQMMRQSKLSLPKQLSLQPVLGSKANGEAPNLELINILSELERATFAAQVELHLLTPQASRENAQWLVYPVRLELSGGYKNLLQFINYMLQQSYLVMVEELVLQNSGGVDVQSSKIKILFTVYKNKKSLFNSASNKPASTNDIALPFPERDIFTPLKNHHQLFLWSSKELHFLGLMKQDQIIFGVVSDPLGGVYRVTIGDKIGLSQSKIVAIDAKGIVTTNAADNVFGALF